MLIPNIFKITQVDRKNFCTNIIETSAPKADFYFLVVLSTLIVALGLLADNVVLVIGGMLVTPLLSPILAIALGIVINEPKVIKRSLKIFLFSFVFAFVVAFVVGVFSDISLNSISLIQKMEPSLLYFLIAAVAGLAASYTWAKSDLKDTLPGIAITVTLIPPLTAIGLAAADMNWIVFGNTIKVLLLNIFGIIVASLLVLSLMDFAKCKRTVIEEVKEEEKELEKERAKLEKEQEKAEKSESTPKKSSKK